MSTDRPSVLEQWNLPLILWDKLTNGNRTLLARLAPDIRANATESRLIGVVMRRLAEALAESEQVVHLSGPHNNVMTLRYAESDLPEDMAIMARQGNRVVITVSSLMDEEYKRRAIVELTQRFYRELPDVQICMWRIHSDTFISLIE